MITLTVIAFNDVAADGTLSANFDELGGSIGRADSNQLVLPDPERTISRVAAQVVYRNGSFALVDRGSNPIVINGKGLGSGREALLKPGDRVRIGGYELSVKAHAVASAAASPASAADPFADLLGPSAAAPSPSGRLHDPLAAADPLAGLGFPGPSPATAPGVRRNAPPPAPPAPASAGGIPTDWDPFAPDSVRVDKPGQAAPRRDALGLEIGGAAPGALVPDLKMPSADPSSLDQMFGLGPASGGDPLANSVLDAPMAKPNMAADADPLRSLQSAPKAVAATETDSVSDLQRPFIPPTMIKPAVPQRPAPPPMAVISHGPGEPPTVSGAVMSWDAGSKSHTVIQAPVRPATPPTAPPAPAAARAAPAPAPATPKPAPAAMSADASALLDAFRRGLNSPTLELPAMTPEMMELLGQLLREAAAGTVDLLAARATFKRELRAQATTIVPRNNNPLKFSPTPEVALHHMLSPPTRGFMAAAPAMRDAYNDLRAHQIGFVAGMQAALEGVLGRFEPAQLEGQLTEKSVLHSLLPATRKARMWDVFVEHYTRIRAEASDDFHTLFGKAFLQAYEEQLDRLQGDNK